MRRQFIRIVFLLFCGSTVFAQTSINKSDEWILYERANALAAQHEYGQALQLYKEAISASGIFPEAEIGVGDIFFEEGEFDLAKAQYEKAYSLRNGFRISEMQYEVLYKLADLYEARTMYKPMEDALLKIASDDRRFAAPESSRLRGQIEKNYFEKGLDHVLFLYQFDVAFAAEAHSRLGWFYYRSGRYSQAVQELLYALIYRTTEIDSFLHDRDVDYQFKTLADMLASVEASKSLSAYVTGSSFFRDLYYLAGSSYAGGYPNHATDIWKIVAASRLSGKYADLSARQLRRPWTEKVIGVDQKGKSY